MAEDYPAGRVSADIETIAVEPGAFVRRMGTAGKALRTDCRLQGFGRNKLPTIGQNHLHPSGHVVDGRTHPAGGRLGIRLPLVQRLETVAASGMRHRAVFPCHEIIEPRTGPGHAKRLKQGLVRKVGPFGPGCFGNRLGAGGQAEIRVGVARSEGAQGLQAQTFEDCLPVKADVFQIVAGMVRQAGTVAVEIPHCQTFGNIGIGKAEPWQQVAHPAVPRNNAARDLPGNDCCSDRLGHGSHLENGVGVNRLIALAAPLSEAFRVDSLSLVYDGNR